MQVLLRDIINNSKEKFSENVAVKWLEKKEVKERSYKELGQNVESVRKALVAERLKGSHIALIGLSSIEWIECYLGTVTGGMVAVPLDAGLPAEDLIDLIQRSDSEGLFLGTKHLPMLDGILASCPNLKKVWILQEQPTEISHSKVSTAYDLKKCGETIEQDVEAPDSDDLMTIIYTSGTTGKSKGVMLTHSNIATNIQAVTFDMEPGEASLSVLPIHHAYCLIMDWFKGLQLGTTICINDSLMHMVKNMGIFKPRIMLMVPLMLETVYKKLAAADPNIPKSVIAENVFGGNLEIIFTGGAHLEPFYIEKFSEYGVLVLEGYGMSECSPVISNNMPDSYKFGSVGKPLSNAEVKFADNGEILVRGSSVMKGYYKMPEETKEALESDGWLHTGDKGYMDEDGFLFINGRVKNLIILSNGENISPEEIENKLALGALVGEVVVTGENNGLTAHIYPDPMVVEAKNMEEEVVKQNLQAFLDEYNKKQPTYRQITGLVVRKNPFIKSSTKKIKRQEVLIDQPV